MKRAFNQGYLLFKRLRKVSGEVGFTMLAYNMRRVLNILGPRFNIKIILKANASKEFDVLVKNRILVPGEPGEAVEEAAGLFSMLCPNEIELSASCVDEFKAGSKI